MAGKNIEGMAALVKRAKEDPEFFHALVWDTEKSLDSVEFLTRGEKAAIMRIDPEDLVVGLATGDFGAVSNAQDCGGSCGVSCGASCGISCGVSCATSCAVSEMMTDPTAAVSRPTEMLGRNMLERTIHDEISRARFTRFQR